MTKFDEAITTANLAELRRQNAELLAENEILKRQLSRWPSRALETALKTRELCRRNG